MPSSRRPLAWLAFALASTWAVLIVAVPPLAAGHWTDTGQGGAGPAISAVTYLTGAFICHQHPERSFHFRDTQWPVCARCAGLYVAAPFGLGWALLHSFAGAGKRRPRRAELSPAVGRMIRLALIITAIPTAVTWSGELLGLIHPSNEIRAASALPLGLSIAAVLGHALGTPQPAPASQRV